MASTWAVIRDSVWVTTSRVTWFGWVVVYNSTLISAYLLIPLVDLDDFGVSESRITHSIISNHWNQPSIEGQPVEHGFWYDRGSN